MGQQKTIATEFSLLGVGIHSGLPVHITVKPSAENTGIVFRRVDQQPAVDIQASIENIAEDKVLRQTVLSKGGVSVKTVEHLMSPLYAYGITNALIEIDQEELPALDGGPSEYNAMIKRVGVREQRAERPVFTVTEPIVVTDTHTNAIMEIHPSDTFQISYEMEHNTEHLADQQLDITITEQVYDAELSGARTFCLRQEAEQLRAAGLGQGASYQNTLVFEYNRPIENELRYPDEAIRHKIIDLVGDFALLGKQLNIHVIAKRTGHSQNVRAVRLMSEYAVTHTQDLTDVSQKEEVMSGGQLNVVEIQNIIPHRYPFLLVDRVIELEPGKRIVAIKNVTVNENFFNGHFPGHPVMPGVLIIEAMAQAGGVMMLNAPENKGKLAYFMSIDNAKFRKPVVPGDQLRFEVEVVKWRSRYGQVSAKAYVDGGLVCQGDLKFSIVPK